MRELEAAHGRRLCQRARLPGRVEVDGTFLTSFPISRRSPHHETEIANLERKRQQKGQEKPKAYKAHIMCLGAQVRGSHAILHVADPVITPISEKLVPRNLTLLKTNH